MEAVLRRTKADLVTKACVGLIDAVEFDGDGSPGTVSTMKFNPGIFNLVQATVSLSLSLSLAIFAFKNTKLNLLSEFLATKSWRTRRC